MGQLATAAAVLTQNWRRWLPLALILGFALWVRSANLTSPYLLDAHAFRQGDTAGFVMGYLQESFNPFSPSVSRQPCGATGVFGRVEAELPLYAWFAALPLKLIGEISAPAPYLRCVWLAYFVASCLYLYRLVRLLGGSRGIGQLTLLTYATLPLAVFFTVSIQPEGPGMLAAFATLYHVAAFMRFRRRRDEIIAVAAGCFMLATKLSFAYVLLPCVYLVLASDGWKALRSPRYWVWLTLVIGSALAWYLYIRETSAWSFGIWDHPTDDKWSTWKFITNPAVYKRLSMRLFQEILTIPGVVLMAAGFTAYRKSEVVKLAAVWLVAYVVFLMATLPVNYVHNYYQLPLVVPAALTIPFALRGLWRGGLAGKGALLILVVAFYFSSHHALHGKDGKFRGMFHEKRSFIPGIQLLERHLQPGEKFVARLGHPELYANSGHAGYIGSKKWPRTARCLREAGVRYLLLDKAHRKHLNKQKRKTRSAYRKIQGRRGYTLYEFTPKAAASPK